jgi:hypothetical protein
MDNQSPDSVEKRNTSLQEATSGDTKPKRKFNSTKTLTILGILLGFVLSGAVGYYAGLNQTGKEPVSEVNQVAPSPTTATKQTTLGEGSKVIYSVQADSSTNTSTLYATDIDGFGRVELASYQNGYEVGLSIPVVSNTDSIMYLDGRSQLASINLDGDKKGLAQSDEGFQIRDFIISDNGKTALYQEFENPVDVDQSCQSFKLLKLDIQTGNEDTLFSSSTQYLKPIKITEDGKRVFVLLGTLSGGEASCYGAANVLQTINFDTKAATTIKTFGLSTNHPFTIELASGLSISPDEKYGILAYSTHPATPLISTPSEEHPVRMSYLDLSTGNEVVLLESANRYLHPIGWYSNKREVLFREQSPDTVENYQNIKDSYKKVDIQTKQVTSLFTLERRGSGMEYSQIVDDNILVYTLRNHPDWENGTSLYKVNLDGSNNVELDKQIRFLYLVGILDPR